MTKDPNNGRLLANRYQIVDLVGEGAMGRVYRAEDKLLGGVIVAVKFLSQALLNEKMRERFEREATICALLGERSIHIVRVRDYGVDRHDIPFYVMEFLQGESLSEIIKPQPLSVQRFLSMTRQICLGMESAHQGIFFRGEPCSIIHRDIKPSNILVVQDPTLGELVKILDFGIAKLVQSSGTQTHSFMGTLAYCSPEQIEGKELDSRSDIYSLGVMMYEMLSGEMPLLPENNSFGGWYQVHRFVEPPPLDPSLKLPPVLGELVIKCLAKSPSDRPQNIGEIFRALESLEQKYSDNRQGIENFQKNFEQDTKPTSIPSVKETSVTSVKEICSQASWPKDKPQQKIVFPRLMNKSQSVFASLWVMLDHQDIFNRTSSIRYNQFLFLPSPHPVILWITLIYNRKHGPRWLPCYLDLKSIIGQRVARILGKSGFYPILLFALDRPQRCQNIMTSTIASNQCKLLKDWANDSQVLRTGQLQLSKRMLKQEFEKLKPKILFKLEAQHNGYPSDISG